MLFLLIFNTMFHQVFPGTMLHQPHFAAIYFNLFFLYHDVDGVSDQFLVATEGVQVGDGMEPLVAENLFDAFLHA